LPNPFLTDVLGNFFFYATAGIYTVQLYGTALPNQLVLLDQNVVAGGGSGSVTSVSLTMPAEFSVAGSPITAAGTLAVSKANENANQVWAGPTSGGAAPPTFRALVAADLTGVAGTVTSVAHTLTVPGALLGSSVTGSPITGAGTLADIITLVNQNANLVFAGATTGGASSPTFRAIVNLDLAGITALATVNPLTFGSIGQTIINASGAIAQVAGLPTIDQGVPALAANLNFTAQTAAIGTTLLFTVPAGFQGSYRVQWGAKVTTPATTSCVLGGANGMQVIYTDQDDSVVVTTPAWWGGGNNGAAPTSAAVNTAQNQMGGEIHVNAKAATTISISFGYTSVGGTSMAYSLHIRLEFLGF
jgi:hypothetical protein